LNFLKIYGLAASTAEPQDLTSLELQPAEFDGTVSHAADRNQLDLNAVREIARRGDLLRSAEEEKDLLNLVEYGTVPALVYQPESSFVQECYWKLRLQSIALSRPLGDSHGQ
jgi:hypothetical protein